MNTNTHTHTHTQTYTHTHKHTGILFSKCKELTCGTRKKSMKRCNIVSSKLLKTIFDNTITKFW